MRKLVGGDAKLAGDEKGEDGGVTLAGVLHVEPELQIAVAGECEHCTLGRRAARMFEHATNAKPAIFAALVRLAAALAEIRVIGELKRLIEHRREIAAVDHGADRRLV